MYGVYAKRRLISGTFPNNCFTKISNRDTIQYIWRLEDKYGNILKGYKTAKNLTNDYIAKKAIKSYPNLLSYDYYMDDCIFKNYRLGNFLDLKNNFYKRIKANKSTYKSLGFNIDNLKPEDIEVEIDSKKYRVAFTKLSTGETYCLDVFLMDFSNYEKEALKAVNMVCGHQCWEDFETNLRNIENCYNLKYIGTYCI